MGNYITTWKSWDSKDLFYYITMVINHLQVMRSSSKWDDPPRSNDGFRSLISPGRTRGRT